METITSDKWDEDVWGVEHATSNTKSQAPELIFYFAEEVWTGPDQYRILKPTNGL